MSQQQQQQPLVLGDRITGLVLGEFSAGTVTRLWQRGFVWKRSEETTQVLSFLHSEGVTWMRGEATLDDRKAMKAAFALRSGR